MKRIHNIRLLRHKGLTEGTMLDLGKINIISGPNSSGKTTVLECIEDWKLHRLGKRLEADLSAKIESAVNIRTNWPNDRYKEKFLALVSESIASAPVWFSDDGEKLLELSLKKWLEHFGRNAIFGDRDRFLGAFNTEFLRPSIVLIPAKRKMETQVLGKYEPVLPIGTGVLNFLFTAKNSQRKKQVDAILDAFRKISGGWEFDTQVRLSEDEDNSQYQIELLLRREAGQWINGSDCGLGLLELIIILYFAVDPSSEVVLIEEPENHLHPEIQRRLIQFLRDHTDKQFFLSTHSSVFLNTQYVDRIFSCKMTDGIEISNFTNRAAMLTDLGYSISDNLVSDLVVLCEGPKDKPVLEEFFRKYRLTEKHTIKVWPLGGDIMAQLDPSVFKENYKVTALVDRDPKSGKVRNRFRATCEALGISVRILKRYAIENYFSLTAIAAVLQKDIPSDLQNLDPNRKVVDQLGFEVKGNNGEIARAMTIEDIEGTDFAEFFDDVKALLKQ